jgi:uncharacterized protein
MIEIDITRFKSGVHHVELRPDPEDLDLPDDLAAGPEPLTADDFADVHVAARLECHRDRILVRLEATATVALTCDRTLRRYRQPLAGTYTLLFGPPHLATPDAADELPYEEIRPLETTDRTLDVTDAVRDTLLLDIPPRKVAPGAEDEAIALHFGAGSEGDEAPVDPRWEALRALKSSSDDD